MTREQAINYLISSGFSEEQVSEIVRALTYKLNAGHWTEKLHVYGVVFCSECGFELRIDNTNYCPNCGAKMVESEVNNG